MERVGTPSNLGKKDSPPEKAESPSLLRKLLETPRDTRSPPTVAGDALAKRRRLSRDSTLEHSILDSSSDGSSSTSTGIQMTLLRVKEMQKYLENARAREAKEKLAEESSGSSQEEHGELAEGYTPFVWSTSTPKKNEEWWSRFDDDDTPVLIIDESEEEKDE